MNDTSKFEKFLLAFGIITILMVLVFETTAGEESHDYIGIGVQEQNMDVSTGSEL